MAKQRLSIQLDKPTAQAPTPAPAPAPQVQQPAPAPKAETKTRASNVALPIEQWRWIDQQHLNVQGTWGMVKKNNIIQALLILAMESNVDLTGAESIDDMVALLKQAFGMGD